MPTTAQMLLESWYRTETTAAAHEAFNDRLRTFYGLGPALIGSKGDENHLSGRHRSRDWDVNSRWCIDRSYATRDARDRVGDGDWLRATDIGIQGQKHWDAAHRLDRAVRAGRLPCIAEWFGTFNGQTVTGWFEGGPGVSDDSHLWHLHVGLWTVSCDDSAQLRLLGDIITGVDSGGSDMPYLVNIKAQSDVWISDGTRRRKLTAGFAALYNQLKAKLGEPMVVANETELTYLAGPVDAELGDGTSSLVPHTHDGGPTGPAIP